MSKQSPSSGELLGKFEISPEQGCYLIFENFYFGGWGRRPYNSTKIGSAYYLFIKTHKLIESIFPTISLQVFLEEIEACKEGQWSDFGYQ